MTSRSVSAAITTVDRPKEQWARRVAPVLHEMTSIQLREFRVCLRFGDEPSDHSPYGFSFN